MNIQELKKYKIKSIRTKSGMVVLGKPAEVIDEGNLFRIADMYVVDKGNIASVEKKNNTIHVEYANGDTYDLGIC